MSESPNRARVELGSDAPWRRRGRYALHVAGLACVALAQPLFDLIGRYSEFLIAHQLSPREIVAFTAILAWTVPAAVALPVVAADLLSRRLGAAFYSVSVWVFASGIFLQVLKSLPAPAFLLVAAALAAGALFALGVRRRPAFGSFLSLVAAGLVVFPSLFLFRPPVSDLLFAESATASAPPVASDTPVVLVIFDELPLASLLVPGRRIDAERFPAFAEVAATSTWFRNTTTVAYTTTLAIPGIVTGRYPDHRHPIASSYPQNLFTWLGASYRMNVFETITRLCPPELCTDPFGAGPGERLRATLSDLVAVYPHVSLPSALTAWAPDVTSNWRDFRKTSAFEAEGRKRGDAGWVFEQFLDSLEPTDEPSLNYLHVNLPHLPWKYLPSGRTYGPAVADMLPHGLHGPRWRDDEWPVAQGYQRHLLQLTYTDRLLGRLLDKLRDTGLFERSLLVVVADHGASFQPGAPRRMANEQNSAEILLVPLFVKLPFQKEGRIRDRGVQTIDILPTIAEALGTDLPWEVAGHSLLSPDGSKPERRVVDLRKADNLKQQRVRGPRFALLDAAVERKTTLFRDGLYGIGPFPELLGSAPESHPLAPPSSLEVELAEPWAFEDVDLESGYLPAHVVGEIRSESAAPPFHLAVALNGEIRAVTRSYSGLQVEKFWAMLPESAFQEGFNQLDLYEVDGGDSEVVLAPIPLKPHLRYTLVRSSAGEIVELVVSDGRRMTVGTSIQGEVTLAGPRFLGWAADLDEDRPAERILLFYDDELVAHFALRGARDVARYFGDRVPTQRAFGLVVPYGQIGEPDPSRLTLLAVLDDRASVLAWREASEIMEEADE